MSATELATVIEGWATLFGLFVVMAGAVFAGKQLRHQTRAQDFQTTMAVLSEVLSRDVGVAWRTIVQRIPEGMNRADMTEEQVEAGIFVAGAYARLGVLLAAGFVKEDDVFRFPNIARNAVETWERWKPYLRANEQAQDTILALMYHEYVAARAQAYLDRKGAEVYGQIPRFDADPELMARVAREVTAARGPIAG